MKSEDRDILTKILGYITKGATDRRLALFYKSIMK